MAPRKLLLFAIFVCLVLTPITALSASSQEPGVPPFKTIDNGANATSAQQAHRMTLIGQIGGSTKAVAVQGDYAYLGVGPRIHVLNVADPAHLTLVGQSPVLPGVVNDLAASGGYLYVAAGEAGLRVVSVSDPTRPVEVGFYDTPGSATGLTVAGDHVFVADGTLRSGNQWVNSGLHIINVADPAHPVEVGVRATPGWSVRVAVAGSYAYVGDQGIWDGSQTVGAGLHVVDITNLTNPLLIGSLEVDDVNAVVVSGNYAFIAGGNGGMKTVDISDPAHPAPLATYGSMYAFDIAVQGNHAYIAGGMSGLEVVDISDPEHPIHQSGASIQGWAQGVFTWGDKAYVAVEYGVGLRIFSVADPALTTEMGSYATKGWAHGLALADNIAYIVAGGGILRVTDVTNPALPSDISSVSYGHHAWLGRRVVVNGNWAYIAQPEQGLRTINVTDPTNPVPTGLYGSVRSVQDVAVEGGLAYLAGASAGLRIIDVSVPANPAEIGFFDTPGSANGVAIVGNRAYVADGSSGLRILDVSTPSQPAEIGFYDTAGSALAVSVAGNYAYIADAGGLRIVDVSNPAAPSEVGYSAIAGYTQDVTVSGHYAYVASGSMGGVRMYDVSNPAAPAEVGFYATGGYGESVEVAGNLIYVAGGSRGLVILRYLDKTLYLPLVTRN